MAERSEGKWKLIAGRQGTPDNWQTIAGIRAMKVHETGDDVGCFDNNSIYQYDSTCSTADDGVIYLKPTNVTTNGRWVRQFIVAAASHNHNSDYDAIGAAATVQGNLNTHTGNTSNPHAVTKSQVGLSNVTNDEQIKAVEKGATNGVATLDNDRKVPVSQLPTISASLSINQEYAITSYLINNL